MARSSAASGVIVILVLIGVVITQIVAAIAAILQPIAIIALTFAGLFLIYQIYVSLYFNSNGFEKIKQSIQDHTNECNELNHHIQELKCAYVNIKSYDYGESQLSDNSKHSFKRREWSKDIKSNQIHNCSATVCKNASNQPFKYLCKYFDIEITEQTLSGFENVLNDFAAAEQGKVLLQKKRELLLRSIRKSVPFLVFSFSKEKLINKLGFDSVDLSDLYFPVYTFQYVSAGGNSSSRCDIKLNVENLDKFIYYLKDLIKFRKSIEGQRALMTSNLREKIKTRDNHSCRKCGLSIDDEPNLLLEIDHIIPVSKGGITTEENLQTLCWKCNRTKGSKVDAIS